MLIDARTAPEGQRMVSFKIQQSLHATRTFYRDTLERSGWAILLEKDGGIRFGINTASGDTICEIDVVMSEGIHDKVTSVIVQEPGVDKNVEAKPREYLEMSKTTSTRATPLTRQCAAAD